MEKAIEIKRRAQRCIQNGDLDGALSEYEKLVGSEDTDPYNFVLLADLLYKKGDHPGASSRYLSAVGAYERAALYKNAIAVCKKMLRLSLSPALVTRNLANLHALDGLAGEASLYYVQYAELMVRGNEPVEAALSLRKAFDTSQDNVRVLEQLAEAYLLSGEQVLAAQAMVEASGHYTERSQPMDARRCAERAKAIDPAAANGIPSLSLPTSVHGELDAKALQHVAETPAASGPAAAPPMPPEPGVWLEPSRSMDAPEPPSRGAAAEPAIEFESHRSDFAPPERVTESHAAPPVPARMPLPTLEELTAKAEAAVEAPAPAFEMPDLDAIEVEPDESEPEEVVYEIPEEDVPAELEAPLAAREAPGLAFGAPGQEEEAPEPAWNGPQPSDALIEVERLLGQAQEQFRAGERDHAGATLALAAQAYEQLGRLDSAATIYRSLGRSASTPPDVLMQWLSNCEKRDDRREAAQVACELGDRALNDGNEPEAREWFQRAHEWDAENDTAIRRLQRLSAAPGAAAAAVATATAAPTATPAPEPTLPEPADMPDGGRVEVAVGRGQAVTFDLGALLSEFQRGVEAQLSGDAQSHYDLGMTYREMGLLEQAVESFQVASQEPALKAAAHEMIGRCHVEQGRPAEAAQEFTAALAALGAGAADALDLHYQLGVALTDAGDGPRALAAFEHVIARQPDFEDAGARANALRQPPGQP